jgi:cytochrome bd-type quinol oxidase subunit 2
LMEAIIFLGYTGLVVSIFPNIVPPTLSIWEAAAPRSSQIFLLVGVMVIVPIILAYTALAYWVFRGKVRHGDEGVPLKTGTGRDSLWSRLGWFAVLYLGGVLAVLMLAAALHILLSGKL